MTMEPKEIIFDEERQKIAIAFAGGVALCRLVVMYGSASEEPVSPSMLDIFIRSDLDAQTETNGTPVSESPRYERHYFEYVCGLIAESLNEAGEEGTPDTVISEIFGIAATHMSEGNLPVRVGVVPSDFSIPESWLEEN
jgi:hypothetical protein